MKKLLLSAALLAVASVCARAETYAVDPVHSFFQFKVGHFGIGNVYGRFNDVSGKVIHDPAAPASDVFDIEVKTASVDTHSEARDKHLRSPDFFNAQQFATATFKSKSVQATDAKNLQVTGDFTLNGVTKSLTIPVTVIGVGKGPQGETRIGGEARFTINRSDYGIKTFLPAITDEVELTIAIEAILQP
jgi:polyisoprenoid-binding protein YceI